MNETTRVEGAAELAAKFKRLPLAIAKTKFRKALSAGARTVRADFVAAAPIYQGPARKGRVAGALKRSAIIKFVRQQSNDQQAMYIVTFRRGKKEQAKNRDAWYAPLVEFGHKVRAPKSSGKTRVQRSFSTTKRTRAVRFATTTFETNRGKYLNTVIVSMGNGFDEAASKA